MGYSESSKLKSPRRRKLSYFDESGSRFLPISSRCLLIRFYLDYHSRSKPPAKVWIFPAKWWRHVMHVGKSCCVWEILTITFGSFEAVWLIEFSVFLHLLQRKRINPTHLGLLMHQDIHFALKITFKIKETFFSWKFLTVSYYLKTTIWRV